MKRNKKRLGKIIYSLFLIFIVLQVDSQHTVLTIGMYIMIYFIIGGDVVMKAIRNCIKGHIFDENFLMSIATIGAFFVGDYIEGVAVMLFYQVGELFQSYAVEQSRRSISKLMDIRPDYANLLVKGKIEKVDPDDVEIGEYIVVKPGERIPLDGEIQEGSTMIDTTALTGESIPREQHPGDEVLSGCVNLSGGITVRVTKEYGDSTVSKILELVENATNKKAQSENFITKFARYYTPIVVVSALLLAILPPLFLQEGFSEWIYRGLTFLVISCPCALVISVPLSFFGGIGGASKLGILVKGSNYLEALAKVDTLVFDKTGTLTKGVFDVQKIHNEGITQEKLLEYTAYVESYSSHPISVSLRKAYGQTITESRIKEIEELSGYGVKGIVDEDHVIAGNEKLMMNEQIAYTPATETGSVVYVAVNKKFVGYILIADQLKADARQGIEDLHHLHIQNIVMLTGDSKKVGEEIGGKLGIRKVYSELLPADKVEKTEQLLDQMQNNGKLAFVGDGINDAPVLARADIGIAMGGIGSDAAIEAADIVIMTDEPSKIATAIKLSKKTLTIVKQNIYFAIGVKLFFLGLGALGLISMGGAVFADVGVTVIAILNAMRCLQVKRLTKTTGSNETANLSTKYSN